MKNRIANISIHQTGKVLAVAYLFLGAVFAVITFLVVLAVGGEAANALGAGIGYLIMFPVLGYLFTALFAYFYNKAADRVGGIEFVLEELEEE